LRRLCTCTQFFIYGFQKQIFFSPKTKSKQFFFELFKTKHFILYIHNLQLYRIHLFISYLQLGLNKHTVILTISWWRPWFDLSWQSRRCVVIDLESIIWPPFAVHFNRSTKVSPITIYDQCQFIPKNIKRSAYVFLS